MHNYKTHKCEEMPSAVSSFSFLMFRLKNGVEGGERRGRFLMALHTRDHRGMFALAEFCFAFSDGGRFRTGGWMVVLGDGGDMQFTEWNIYVCFSPV